MINRIAPISGTSWVVLPILGFILAVGFVSTLLAIRLHETSAVTATTSSFSGLELVSGTDLSIIRGCSDGEITKWTAATGTWECAADSTTAVTGAGAIILDLGDDDVHESTALAEIATTGDTNSIFTESAADKLLIAVGNNWPTSDTADALSADPSDCAANQFANAIIASGNLTCAQPDFTDLSGTATDAQVPNTITIDLSTNATNLAADPADCGADTKADAIDAQGDLTCTAVDTGDIANGTILPIDLDDGADVPADEECLTYEGTGAIFEWQGCGGGFTSFDIDGDNNSPQTITDGNEALFAGGAGILTTASATDTITIATASGETGFLASGALTCGGGTAGRTQVHTTPLQYCDNAGTPVLQYAAYAASDGDALAGDSATAFFDGGQIEAVRGGTGDDTSGVTGVPRIAAGNWTYDAGISHLAASTSADLAGVLSDEEGSGQVVFDTAPVFVTNITSPVVISGAGDPADAGVLRLGNAELIGWEASPTGADVTLAVDASEIFQFSAPVDVVTGYRIGGAAASGEYLRGNATNFVSSTIQAGDLGSGYIDALTDFSATLCATTEILEDQGGSWACIATPSGGGEDLQGTYDLESAPALITLTDALGGIQINGDAEVSDASLTILDDSPSATDIGILIDNNDEAGAEDSPGLRFADSTAGAGDNQFTMLVTAGTFVIQGDDDATDLTIDASGNVVGALDITATTIASIAAANLVDKSATETITGEWTFDSVADNEWSPITEDLIVGDADEGQIRLGTLYIGQADDTISTTVLDDVAIFVNTAGTLAEGISFIFSGPGDVPRFVLSDEGADLATYNPRSFIVGPSATIGNVDENVLCSTNFSIIDCDTGTSGADLGVMDDVEILGALYTVEALTLGDNTDANRTITWDTLTGDFTLIYDEITDNRFELNAAVDSTGNISATIFDADTGYRIGGAAASGEYLRGDATNFVSSTIQPADLGSGFIDALGDFASTLCGTNEILEDQGGSWACIATPSGAFTSFDIDGDNNSPQTITDGNEALFAGGTNGIDTVASATDTITFNFDPTEVGAVTWLDNADRTWAFDIAAAGTNPTIAFAAVSIEVDADFTIDNQQDLRLKEGDGGGENYIAFEAPATITSNGTCTLLDSTTDVVPDTCIGGILADEEIALGAETSGGYAASTGEGGGATSLEAGALDALTEIASGLCGTTEILEDQGGSWACIATPTSLGGEDLQGTYDLESAPALITITDALGGIQFNGDAETVEATLTILDDVAGQVALLIDNNDEAAAENSPILRLANSTVAGGDIQFDLVVTATSLEFRGDDSVSDLTIDGSGNITGALDITATTIASIAAANLVDKTVTETISGAWTFDSVADREWSPLTRDLVIGDADEGQLQIGTLYIGQADDTVSTTVLDDIVIFSNTAAAPIENISFLFTGATLTTPRFVLAVEGADLATYNPRSMVIGPAATMANVDENIICSTNFSVIDCDTGASGADLGVMDDVEILGTLYPVEGITLGDNTDANRSITWNTLTSDNTLIYDEVTDNRFEFSAAVDVTALTEAGNAVPNSTDGLDFFAATTSAELAGVISNETGSGLLVYGTSPTFLTSVLIDNQGELRLGEPDGAGSEYIIIEAPATLAANRTCTLEDDATPFDPCITSGGGMTSFDIDGDNNSPQTITNSEEALFVGGLGIDTTAAVTDQVTFDFDAAEIGTETWLDNADRTWTFDIAAAGVNPTLAFAAASVEADADFIIDNQQDLRLKEGDGGGENYVGFNAPATITANGICTLLDSTTDIIPDTCVGGILADEEIALGTETSGGYAASTGEGGGAASLEAGALDALTEIAGALCGTNEILEDQGGSWACISTPTGTFISFDIDGDNNSPQTITDGNEALIAGGAGILTTASATDTVTVATASGETDFLASGALTCGASTQGRAQVHTTPLQYCDNTATPVLQYAAYGASDGDALAGDSATSFFDAGTIEAARGGTGDDTSGTTGMPRITSGNWTYDAGISHLAASTSADLAGVLSDEEGSGQAVFDNSPTFVTQITSPVVISGDSDPADAGVLRLGNAELIAWEAAPAAADITLTVDSSEVMQASGTFNAATLTEGGTGVPNTGDNLSVFAATTSAQLLGVLSDETGSGLAVFGTNPTFADSITLGDNTDANRSITWDTLTGNFTLIYDEVTDNRFEFSAAVDVTALTEAGNAVPNSTDGLDFFAVTTSAELAGVISNETGSGLLAFATDPTFLTTVLLDNQAELRLGEPDGAGSEYIIIEAPATLAANRTCTLEDDATPFDPCVSGGFISFDIDGDNNSPQTITDGNEALLVGGDGVITTAAATDQVTFDVDLNVTLDGVGSSTNLSGLEFTATAELALLQGCTDNFILKWNDTPGTWDCEVDATGGTVDLQGAYDNEVAPALITLTDALGGIQINGDAETTEPTFTILDDSPSSTDLGVLVDNDDETGDADSPWVQIRNSTTAGGDIQFSLRVSSGSEFEILGDDDVADLTIQSDGDLSLAAGLVIETPDTNRIHGQVESKGIAVENVVDSEDITIFFTDQAITVIEVRCVFVGTTPSTAVDIRHHTDRSNAGNDLDTTAMTCSSTTTGNSFTSGFEDATIPLDSFVWFETASTSGTTDLLHIEIIYTVD